MKSKRFLIPVLILSAFIIAACAGTAGFAQRIVSLPDPLVVAINAAAVFVVGWIFAQIGARLPWFIKIFGQYADEIAFALGGGLITFINSWLSTIPSGWEGAANQFFLFVVAVLAALSAFRLLGKAKVTTFR